MCPGYALLIDSQNMHAASLFTSLFYGKLKMHIRKL